MNQLVLVGRGFSWRARFQKTYSMGRINPKIAAPERQGSMTVPQQSPFLLEIMVCLFCYQGSLWTLLGI